MKKAYDIVLSDVYGGDGEIRHIEVEEPRLTRKKTTTRTKSDLGIPVKSDMDEVLTQKTKKEVHTFRSLDGKQILRLGGVHGKLWGALREARQILYAMGRAEYRSARLIDTIQVQPVWVQLEAMEKMQTVVLPQILNVMGGRSMVIMHYDVIPRCNVRVEFIFPDNLLNYFEGLLAQIQNMGLLNKRRATIQQVTELKK